MTIILGQLEQFDGDSRGSLEPTGAIRATIDDIAALSEKARLVELAVMHDERQYYPVDTVACVNAVIETTHAVDDAVAVETELPDAAWAQADWMLETAVEKILQAVRVHGSRSRVSISVTRTDTGRVSIRIVDDEGCLTEPEIETLESGTETPLKHSEGLDLWIARWIVQGYGGSISVENDDTCAITINLQRTMPLRLGE